MSGLKVVLPVATTDLTRPILYDDPLMSAGSLMLVDPIHDANPWPSGVPANGALLPNIATLPAKAILGSGAEVRPSMSISAPWTANPSLVKLERSGKGGLHGLVAQAGMTAYIDNLYASIALPAALLAYMLANPSHSYYYSLWKYSTRVSSTSTASAMAWFCGITDGRANGSGGSPATNFFFSMRTGLYRPVVPNAQVLGASAPTLPETAPGAAYQDLAENALAGSGSGLSLGGSASQWGSPGNGAHADVAGNINSAVDSAHLPSFILYRFYMEDLTVSGRSYATVHALDLAQYTTDVATAGGRYNADTFTAVSTIP